MSISLELGRLSVAMTEFSGLCFTSTRVDQRHIFVAVTSFGIADVLARPNFVTKLGFNIPRQAGLL